MRHLASLFVAAAFLAAGTTHVSCALAAPSHRPSVTITRDDWGIAHVHGKTDADAVYGMIYAQAEDDFNRIERNFLTALGRPAPAPFHRPRRPEGRLSQKSGLAA